MSELLFEYALAGALYMSGNALGLLGFLVFELTGSGWSKYILLALYACLI